MKYTTLDNENVTEKDERIVDLDKIVTEVKQSEEWEAVEMNMKNFHMNLQEACAGLEISVEEYENAKQQIARWEKERRDRY